MAIVISGVNNNDKITASDGTIDLLSGVNLAGILTAPAFSATGNITGATGTFTGLTASYANIADNKIILGNAGVCTAISFVGNITGNVNNTGNLLLQISGSEKFRVGGSGQLGIGGANYGSSGQVLTSGGSGSAATWSTISGTTINNNADNRVITGSGTANTLNAESTLTWSGVLLDLFQNTTAETGLKIRNSEGSCLIRTNDDKTFVDTDELIIRNEASTERLRIDSSGKVSIASAAYGGGGTTPELYLRGTSGRQMKIHNSNAGTSSLQITNASTGEGEDAGTQLFTQGTTGDFHIQNAFATGDIAFATKPSGGSTTERLRIASDGKLYKSGNQFYPLVNYSEYATFSAVNVSSSSYTDLRTILSGYTPKKAGNIIVIHHQSQCWQGYDANSNGDAMWKIQKQEGGGSWTDVIANERIMGNMDGRNYTGGSGLSRHHRTVHLMGSFECAGTSINLKSQGKVDFTSPGLQWYHHSQNILQVWEYEKG